MSLPQVYVVSSGSYSDYTVHFACPDKKTAEAMVKHLNGRGKWGDYEVRELPLYDSLGALAPGKSFVVEVDIDGIETRRLENSYDPWEGEYYMAGWVPAGYARGVSDRSYDVALKSARDHAAKHRAKKAGVAS